MKLATLILFLCAPATMGQTSNTTSDDSRWEYICLTGEKEPVYIDKQSLKWTTRDGRADSSRGYHVVADAAHYVEFWYKTTASFSAFSDNDSKTDTKHADSSETLYRLQMERTTKRVRILSYARYDASGKLLSSSNEASTWDDIIPDTIGEALYDHLFPPKQQGKYSISDLVPEERKPREHD